MNRFMTTNKGGDDDRSEREDTKWFIISMAALLVFVLFVGYYALAQHGEGPKHIFPGDVFPGAGDAAEGHLPDMEEWTLTERMQKEADESVFSFKVNAQPVFQDGGSEGTLRIENPQHNIYPFVVEIILDGTGETLFDSGGVLPNHHIDKAKLSKQLPKGRHAATAYVKAYDPVTDEYRGKSAVELTLVIEN